MLSKEAYPEVGMEVDQATLPNLDIEPYWVGVGF